MENEYYRKKLFDNIKKYKEKHRLSYYSLKNLENLLNNSEDIPFSTIYTTLNHLEREKSNVLGEINNTINDLLPKKESTKQDTGQENTSEKQDTSNNPEQASEKQTTEKDSNNKSNENKNNDINKEIKGPNDEIDSDDEFDLEE